MADFFCLPRGGFPEPPPARSGRAGAQNWRSLFHILARHSLAHHHRLDLVIALGPLQAFRVLRPRWPCRPPAPGVLPGAPFAPSFVGESGRADALLFFGYRFVFALHACKGFPLLHPSQGLPLAAMHRPPDGCRPFAGAHAARTPLFLDTHAASGALPPLTPARGARAGARCFS